MIHIGLFEGIGGFSLASRWMGWKTYVTCEIAEFPRKVLQYHFPQAYHHSDIHTLNYETINTELSNRYGNEWRNDEIILTGGFPCQPYSQAGKRLGKEDERHLWPQMLRAIQEIKPTYVVGENVRGLTNWNGGVVFEEVCTDLESCGYEVQPILLPACAIGAPHRRDRIWFVAYYKGKGWGKGERQEINYDKWEMVQCGQKWNEIRNDIGASDTPRSRTATDTISFRLQHTEETRNIQEITRTPQSKGSKFTEPFETNGSNGDVTDTKNADNVTNTECIGWDEKWNDDGIAKKTQQKKCGEKQFSGTDSTSSKWRNFPSQSPVCSRNDGISYGLDNITFSKWRNESIKAYGNAIVPGIAYEIFKAINLLNE